MKEFILPEKWYCVVTEENIKVLSKWRFGEEEDYKTVPNFKPGCIVGYCLDWASTREWNYEIDGSWINEITFTQFQKYVLGLEIEKPNEDYSYLIPIITKLNHEIILIER
jgi:hypothetical protein